VTRLVIGKGPAGRFYARSAGECWWVRHEARQGYERLCLAGG
jgi:hypothetical protein